jgi:hypothetical protein
MILTANPDFDPVERKSGLQSPGVCFPALSLSLSPQNLVPQFSNARAIISEAAVIVRNNWPWQ